MQLEFTEQQLMAAALTAAATAAAVALRYGVRWLRQRTVAETTKGWWTVFAGCALIGVGGANWNDNHRPDLLSRSPHSLSDNPEVARAQLSLVAMTNEQNLKQSVGERAFLPIWAAVPLTVLGIAVGICGVVMTVNGYSCPTPVRRSDYEVPD